MGLNWDVGRVKNYKTFCYDRLTDAEAEARGTTLDALMGETSFMGPHWSRPNETDLEKLAAGQDYITRLSPLTNMLLYATMGVAMGRITEDNWGEFWVRLHLLETLIGPFMHDRDADGKWQPRPVKPEEVKAHIGLSCNVHTEPWAVWMKKQMDRWRTKALNTHSLEDPRDQGNRASLSQVAGDLMDMTEMWSTALTDHDLGDDSTENAQHSADYRWAQRAVRHLGESVDYWESREAEIEDEAGEE